MPVLPAKFEKGGIDNDDGERVSADQMIRQLEEYMNEVIQLSPLICNLHVFRVFVTSGHTNDQSIDRTGSHDDI
jgi:hypothetical protein